MKKKRKKKEREQDKVSIRVLESEKEKEKKNMQYSYRQSLAENQRHFTTKLKPLATKLLPIRLAIRHLPTRTRLIQRNDLITYNWIINSIYIAGRTGPFLDNTGIDIAGN